MRQMFGASTIQSIDREVGDNSSRSGRHNQARRLAHRKSLFLSPRDTWDRFTGGVTMELYDKKQEGQFFRYKFSKEFEQLSRQMNGFQGNMQEYQQTLVNAFSQNCYHPDLGLLLYEMCMMANNSEPEFSEDVLLRIVYGLEMSWHPKFSVAQGSTRLPIAEGQNRIFFQVMFRYIQNLIRRSCHRCALECSKLLLALDLDDPMGVLQLIDYLALRSGCDTYLDNLIKQFPQQEMLHLPNYNYSLGYLLAKKLSTGDQSKGKEKKETLKQKDRQNLKGAQKNKNSQGIKDTINQKDTSNLKDAEELALKLCMNQMTKSVCMFPSVIPKLIKKLNTQGYAREKEWKTIQEHKLFKEPQDAKSASLNHLSDIYVERSNALWKASIPLKELLKGCQQAIQLVDTKSPEYQQYNKTTRELWPPSEKNKYSELHVQDFGDQIFIPEDEQEQEPQQEVAENRRFDPFQRINVQNRDTQNANSFALFLESILPWVNVIQENSQDQPPVEGGHVNDNGSNNENNNNNNENNQNNNQDQ